MSDYILNQIQNILKNAGDVISIKTNIINTIYKVLDDLCLATENKICIEKTAPNDFIKSQGYSNSDEVILIKKSGDYTNQFPRLLIFGYSVNSSTGYPVIFETRSEEFSVFDESELIDFLLNRIEKNSVKIMEVANAKMDQSLDDLPF